VRNAGKFAQQFNFLLMDLVLKKYDDFIKKNQSNYFSFIAMTILVGSIWGGVAAMFIDKANAPIWMLALNVGMAMANNIVAIGQAPLKWVLNIFIANMVVNAILMALNF
jgi:hypothetical protein